MPHRRSLPCAALLAAGLIAGCQARLTEDPKVERASARPPAAGPSISDMGEGASEASQPQPVDWTAGGDCLETLRLVHTAAREGRLTPAERPPIAIVVPDALPMGGWSQAAAVPVAADLPLEVRAAATAAPGVPCLVQIERAQAQRADHRVLGQEVVRSLYQSGVRSERNPDYEVAEARLRQAERRLKDDVPDIISVGDPLLDLVGLVVGGVLGVFSRAGSSSEVDHALAELAATPRSIDRPVYRPYHFEQTIVLAEREATIPVALIDRSNGHLVRTALRQREVREFNLLEKLDARDRDYPQHRAASVTRSELERWLSQPPELPLSTVVAALLDAGVGAGHGTQVAALPGPVGAGAGWAPRSAAAPLPTDQAPTVPDEEDWPEGLVAEEAPMLRGGLPDDEPWPGDLVEADEAVNWPDLEPAARPQSSSPPRLGLGALPLADQPTERPRRRHADDAAPAPAAVIAASGDRRRWSVVEIAAEDRSGSGFYVLPDMVLTTYQLVRDQLVVDVATFDGALVPGLVARTDPALDLALVQVPKPGLPVALGDDLAAGPGGHVMALGQRRGLAPTLTPARLKAGGWGAGGLPNWLVETEGAAPELAMGSPLFLGEQVVGMTTGLAGESGPRPALRTSALLAFLKDDLARPLGSRP